MITVEEVCAQISEIAHGVTINPDGKLDESGIDSMTLVRLILQLEGEFDVIFPDELLGPETFETPRSITNALNFSKG
ncbi:hypothetical protein ID853_08070 [Xenorhabdus sp. Vera]|uniref:phosphopantetheine-binding protein n=1 Tax=Xenorhabdus koppenhoeferi TaxID=351659 RepID=UPI0019A93B31|nr:phosphopantetheine-binding protein [Xenorhabdus sp. Vera]MBD2810835.1 hypothetical protein [Xenorhabdus sp. Vera]